MKIMLAQCAPRVGDIDGNLALAHKMMQQASETTCQLLVLPELFVTGYPPEDLLLRHDFIRAAQTATQTLIAASATFDLALIFGHPESHAEGLTNAVTLAWQGRRIGIYHKQALPNYGVFDERRYFVSGQRNQPPLIWSDLRLRLTICEDLWQPDIAARMAKDACDLVISINASPFQLGKQQHRQQLLQQQACQFHAPLLYVNCVGGQDELVFDGGSCMHSGQGTLLARSPLFTADNLVIDDAMVEHPGKLAELPSQEALLHQALVTGTRDYLHRNGAKQAVLGLSGGIDSALCAAIACDALGARNVLGVLLPSQHSSDHSIADAQALAANLNMDAITLPIIDGVTAIDQLLAPHWKAMQQTQQGVAEENIQARMRGLLLMAISNKTGRMLLTTGNKSEMAVGYATLYGDMAGGFAPLKDVYKTQAYALAHYINQSETRIPPNSIHKPPSAELRPGQMDSDSLPDYSVLDPILQQMIEHDQGSEEVAAAGFAREDVELAQQLLRQSEHKRCQAPPGVKVTARAFGRDRRYPITHSWRG
ncbi:MAG: NAD+ synthase [Mariprofundales bacterium]